MIRNLKLIRESKGVSRSALSKETGVSPDSIWKFETGRTTMTNKRLKKIAKYFKMTLDELSKEIEDENSKILQAKKCQNQRCGLNNKCYCQSEQVIEGAQCNNQHLVTEKAKKIVLDNISLSFAEI
ncbi:helix-turn-helix domain-containing protein [Clostridium beijerinckii]|uniref:helix-turn-helix domain-containing protein n=1 Tax=Clostridium beijerinckii TaxID=1520 RepID=UPI0023302844|nr:helix-turn-helix transcriptional regulator [Clostridium beijerinckii]